MSNAEGKHAAGLDAEYRQWRPWLDIRWITACVIVGTITFLAWGLFGPEPTIRVSRETTYLTSPLAADGLPDYWAAALVMEGPAPPPDDNAAAGLLQVLWPFGIDGSDLPSVCRAMGIPDDPPAIGFRHRIRTPLQTSRWKRLTQGWNGLGALPTCLSWRPGSMPTRPNSTC